MIRFPLPITTTLLSIGFFFIILDQHNESFDGWREAPPEPGYVSYAECKEGQDWYRMNDESGAFSECYGREVTHGK